MQILQNPNFPETFPFGPEEFQRYDETPDTSFYSQPRFVTHIDDGAIAALTKYIYTDSALHIKCTNPHVDAPLHMHMVSMLPIAQRQSQASPRI